MLYLLDNETRREVVLDKIKKALLNGKWSVEFKEYKKTRTTAQNALMHMWFDDIARHLRSSQGSKVTAKSVKRQCKAEFLGAEESTVRGINLVELVETSTLKVSEMTEFLEKIEALGRKLGARMRIPDDYKWAMYGVKVNGKTVE